MAFKRAGADAILMQLPMGAGESFEGVIDLVIQKALYFLLKKLQCKLKVIVVRNLLKNCI